MREYCTYFDSNYLCQGVALYRSLERWGGDFRLWILCLDDQARQVVSQLGFARAEILTIDDLMAHESRLAGARSDRSKYEFYYVCTPELVRYVRDRCGTGTSVTYIDADMYFFGSAERMFDEVPEAETLIIEHRSKDHESEVKCGRFNVCLVHFADTRDGRAVSEWWFERTLESTRLGDGVWGDQKYLDEFPRLSDRVGILRDPGVGLAPWSVWRHQFEQGEDGAVLVDGQPLTVYHFARYIMLGPKMFIPIRRDYLQRPVIDLIYGPYMDASRSAFNEIRRIVPGYRIGYSRHNARGALLGLTSGRVFYKSDRAPRRLGVYVPSTRIEVEKLLRNLRSPTWPRRFWA